MYCCKGAEGAEEFSAAWIYRSARHSLSKLTAEGNEVSLPRS
jgi:hypothetical protein